MTKNGKGLDYYANMELEVKLEEELPPDQPSRMRLKKETFAKYNRENPKTRYRISDLR